MKHISKFFKTEPYLKHLAVTGSGVLAGVLINVLTTPLLSRIFTPEAYGVAGFYSQSLQYLVLASTMMLPTAIVVVRRSSLLYRLISSLKLLWILGFSMTMVLAWLLGKYVQDLLNDSSDGWWLFLLAFGLVSGQLVELANGLNVRATAFATNVKANLSSSIFSRGLSLLAGWLTMGHYLALIVPGILNFLPVLLQQKWSDIKKIWRIRPQWTSLEHTLGQLRNYPLYMLPANLLSIAAISAPFFVLGILYSPAVAGLFLFAENMLLIPFRFSNRAVTPVYLQEISNSFHDDQPAFKRVSLSTNRWLFLTGLIPFAIITVFGPDIFKWVFGTDWEEAGRMAQYMAFFVLFRLSTSPLSAIYRVAKQEQQALVTQSVLFVLRVLPLAVGLYCFSLYDGLLFFAVGSLLGYWFHFYQLCRVGELPFFRTILWQCAIFSLSCGSLWIIKYLLS